MKEVVKPYQSEDKSKKVEVEQMFDAIAPTYDRLNRLLSLRIDTLWRNNVIKLLKKQNPESILDIATGTGDLAIAMSTLFEKGTKRITGLDLSQEMLAVGRKKLKQKNLDQKIDFVKGDSEHLPFDDQEFEAITCAFGVRNFENLDAGLRQMHRVLSDKGQLIILEFSTPENKIFNAIYNFYFFHVLPFVGNLISGDSRAYTYLPESVKAFPSGQAFAERLKAAGFNKIICKPQTFGICTIYQATK